MNDGRSSCWSDGVIHHRSAFASPILSVATFERDTDQTSGPQSNRTLFTAGGIQLFDDDIRRARRQ
ncbi:hypothetical protein BRAS3843_1310021 [Bradyrhizobium sp. STM 3843]|nr:hypothetical protein BRAS3843_1310021 [Bradyrhizobium sp. STM 3843]